MNDDNNIFRLVSEQAPAAEDTTVPVYDYFIVDTDGNEHFASGFLLFTSQHIAIMRDTDKGALPVFVIPLGNVKFAELAEDDEEIVFDA